MLTILLVAAATTSSGCATLLTAILTQDAAATAAVAEVEAAVIVSMATADYGDGQEELEEQEEIAPAPAPRPIRTLPRHPDRRLVNSAIRRHLPEVDVCRPLMPDPKAGHEASVFLHIEPDGSPSHIAVTGPDTAPLAECTQDVIAAWRFPRAMEMTSIRFAVRWEAFDREPTMQEAPGALLAQSR
ncbi:MAG: hypothetical protein DRJ42_12000 [Deltaproteobacteria bacterium]|nr:MAG: hypothetical protein DRJ42_12000 [Deltaproteobacteria bacterium]